MAARLRELRLLEEPALAPLRELVVRALARVRVPERVPPVPERELVLAREAVLARGRLALDERAVPLDERALAPPDRARDLVRVAR